MQSFNNPFAENNRKTFLWRAFWNALDRNILNNKTSATDKIFLTNEQF